MILDDGGDATMLVHLGVEVEKKGEAPDPATATSHEQKVVFDVLRRLARRGAATAGPRSPPSCAASPRRPRRACTGSTT